MTDYPSWRAWLFGGQWSIPNGGVVCPSLPRRLYNRYVWTFKHRLRMRWYRRFGFPQSMTGAEFEGEQR